MYASFDLKVTAIFRVLCWSLLQVLPLSVVIMTVLAPSAIAVDCVEGASVASDFLPLLSAKDLLHKSIPLNTTHVDMLQQ